VLSPFGGLKKLFKPVHKAVTKVGGAVHKGVGAMTGPMRPKAKPPVSRLAPKAANSGGTAVARKKEMY
jgi:hypothetical protein